MKKSKLKILLMVVIIGIFTIGMPMVAYGTNENTVIVKQSDNEYLIYLKGYLNKEFQFAFSNNKEADVATLAFVNSAVDSAQGINNIAYVNDNATIALFANKTYMWVKVDGELKISGLEIDIKDNITKTELEEISTISKNIPIKLEQEQTVNEVNENGTKITETVGVAKLIYELRNGKYQLIARKSTTDNDNFFALAELLEKNQFTDKYTEIKASKEFLELAENLLSILRDEEWKTIENNTIKQPADAQNGEQYILWLVADNDVDVHFLTSLRKYDEEVVKEEVRTKLPHTYDNNTILIIFAIVVVAIVAVSIRIAVLKKKEMSK